MLKFTEAADVAFTSGAKIGAFKGAVLNLNNNDYHSLNHYYSSTQLKYMHETSPLHFNVKYNSKDKEPSEPTKSMILGSLVHCMVLTPNEFEKDFFIMPDLNFRTNEGKATKEKIIMENPNKIAITDELLLEARAMRESILSNKRAVELLEPGRKEAAYFWNCPFSQLNMKAKLDQSSSKHFVELKTSISAKKEEFERQAYNMHYDLSLYHYRTALSQTMDVEPVAYFIVVENKAPYATVVYPVDESFWLTGQQKWLSAVTKLEAGIKKKEWSGYYADDEDVPPIGAPAWAMRNIQTEEVSGGI